jgi:putative drug exporter of the RND superfamily
MITSRVERAHAAQAARGAMTPLGRLGWWSMRHRWLVVAGWVVVLVVMTMAGRLAGSQFKTDLTGGNTQSQQAASFLREQFSAQAGDTAQVVFATRAPVTSAADRARINQTLARLAGLPHVAFVRGPFSRGAHQVSPDGHLAPDIVSVLVRRRAHGAGDLGVRVANEHKTGLRNLSEP